MTYLEIKKTTNKVLFKIGDADPITSVAGRNSRNNVFRCKETTNKVLLNIFRGFKVTGKVILMF